MTVNVLDSLSSIFGSQITRQVSAFFGDSEESTRAGLRASFSTLLAGLVHKSTIAGGADELLGTVTSESVDSSANTRLASILANRGSLDPALATGESMVKSIFGNRSGSVVSAVSEVSGVKASSATGLLAMAAPMLFGVLKRQVTQGSLDARGLGSLLLNQRGALQKAGLDSRITSAMGFGSLQSMLGSAAEDTRATGVEGAAQTAANPPAYSSPIAVKRRERRWIPWAVAAAVALLALVLLSSRLGNRPGAQTAATSLPASVYFDSGQAALNDDDRRIIAAVASSVKAGDAPVAVTGYTDQSGNLDQNLELAKDRAAAVRDALVQEGVPASRVVMAPPASLTGTGSAEDARRVEITLAQADTGALR